MGLYHSPRAVTDGLVVHLDAENTKSFPGGDVLRDLSKNNNHPTIGGSGLTSAAEIPGTVLDYSGTTGSITCTFTPFNKYSWSISYMARGITPIDPDNYRVIFRLNDDSGGGSGYIFYADTRLPATPYILHFQRDYHISSWDTQSVVAQSNFLLGSPATNGPWYIIDTVYRTAGVGSPQPAEWETWVNGQSIGVKTVTKNISNIGDADELIINASSGMALQMQYFKLYNRSLSEAEVKQNYNAMRGRLGQ